MAVNFGWEKTGNSQHGQKWFIAPLCTFHRPNDFEMLWKGCNVFHVTNLLKSDILEVIQCHSWVYLRIR